jgi:hypothetical protein
MYPFRIIGFEDGVEGLKEGNRWRLKKKGSDTVDIGRRATQMYFHIGFIQA